MLVWIYIVVFGGLWLKYEIKEGRIHQSIEKSKRMDARELHVSGRSFKETHVSGRYIGKHEKKRR